MFTRLIYASRTAPELRDRPSSAIAASIAEASLSDNPALQITGEFILGPDWFAQVLEGRPDAVCSRFRAILNDARHARLELVDLRLVRERQPIATCRHVREPLAVWLDTIRADRALLPDVPDIPFDWSLVTLYPAGRPPVLKPEPTPVIRSSVILAA